MSKPILTLPCKYTLSDFEPRDGKHHCAACDHSLKDFRSSTNAEIHNELAAMNGKTCGIFRPEQVDAKTSTFALGLQQRLRLSLLGILGYLAPAVLTSCEDESTVHFTTDKTEKEQEQEAFSKLQFPMTIAGQLTDRTNGGTPLGMATIKICQGTTVLRETQTDVNGRFELTLEKDDLRHPDFELVAERIGYEQEVCAEVENLPDYRRKQLTISLKAQPKTIDGLTYLPTIIAGGISGSITTCGFPPDEPAPVSLEPVIAATAHRDAHDEN